MTDASKDHSECQHGDAPALVRWLLIDTGTTREIDAHLGTCTTAQWPADLVAEFRMMARGGCSALLGLSNFLASRNVASRISGLLFGVASGADSFVV